MGGELKIGAQITVDFTYSYWDDWVTEQNKYHRTHDHLTDYILPIVQQAMLNIGAKDVEVRLVDHDVD